MKALIYDCEIIKAIPPNGNEPLQDGIEYCSGWGDHANMGVSVIGVYSYEQDRYRVFCKDNWADFSSLLMAADIAVGFNNIGFDDKLLKATGILPEYEDTKRYDIMREVMAAAGSASFAGFSLDAICKATLNEGKTGNGAVAPVQWQRGEIGSVVDYCLMDVRLTKRLFDRALAGAPIRDPKTMREIKLRAPT